MKSLIIVNLLRLSCPIKVSALVADDHGDRRTTVVTTVSSERRSRKLDNRTRNDFLARITRLT